jgi:uncharacterized phiE125 gp8 family phage protein
MSLVLTTPPAVEPVSLAQAKLHLRLDGDAEDVLVASLITAVRMTVERKASLALVEQGWTLTLDAWPRGREIAVPLAPVSEVTSLTVYGEDDTPAEVDPAHYVVDLASRPARVVLRTSRTWPPPGRPAAGIAIARSGAARAGDPAARGALVRASRGR